MTGPYSPSRWLDHYDLRISPQPLSSVVWITLYLIVIFSITMRIHSLDRSFWLDEVWVANAIIAPTLSEMVYYEGWLNTSPPLFLLLVRFATQLFGVSHVSMRLIPVLFGILSILAMAYLALRLLKPWYALVAVLLLVLSPDHVILSQSAKPYTADVFVTLVLLILGYHFLRTHSRKIFYAAVILFGVCGFLSYQAVMFMPIFFSAAFLHDRESNRHRNWHTAISRGVDVIVLILVLGAVSFINYFYFIEPNVRPEIVQGKLAEDFYSKTSILESVYYFLAALANLTHPLCSTIRSSLFLRVGVLAIILAGVVGFVFHKEEREPTQWKVVALLVLPILSLIGLNWLGQYPMSRTPRLVLFIFPVITILFVSGVQFVIQLCTCIADRTGILDAGATKINDNLAPAVLVITICLFAAKLVFVDLSPHFRLSSSEDAKAALHYLSGQHTDGDLLYVHATMREHYKFYSKIFPLSGGRVIEGNVGLWCCQRHRVSDRLISPITGMSAEFARLNLSSEDRHVRLLFSGRRSRQKSIDPNERREFKIRLSEKGCVRLKTTTFVGVRIDEYTCQLNSFRDPS